MFSLTEFNSSYAVPHFLLDLFGNLFAAIELRWDDFVMTALASSTGLPSPHSHPLGHGRAQDKGREPLSDSSQSRMSHLWKKAFLLFACEYATQH